MVGLALPGALTNYCPSVFDTVGWVICVETTVLVIAHEWFE